jgi:hypothetical protein
MFSFLHSDKVHIADLSPSSVAEDTRKRAKGTMVHYKLAAAALLSLSATKAYVYSFVVAFVGLARESIGGDGFSSLGRHTVDPAKLKFLYHGTP